MYQPGHFCKEATSRSERRIQQMEEDNNDGTKCSFTEQLIISPYADTTFTHNENRRASKNSKIFLGKFIL